MLSLSPLEGTGHTIRSIPRYLVSKQRLFPPDVLFLSLPVWKDNEWLLFYSYFVIVIAPVLYGMLLV